MFDFTCDHSYNFKLYPKIGTWGCYDANGNYKTPINNNMNTMIFILLCILLIYLIYQYKNYKSKILLKNREDGKIMYQNNWNYIQKIN